jgi:hypothetical protein
MAVSLKRIEKEFILCAVRDANMRLLLIAGSGEWPVTISEVGSDSLTISHAMPTRLIKKGSVYEFRFVYHEQAMAFRAKVGLIKEESLVVEMPQSVFKNLGRRYSRRHPPAEFTVSFSFEGERYDLAFPTTRQYEDIVEPETSPKFDPKDIKILVSDFNEEAGQYASERAIRMFKDKEPETPEEKLIVKTGKVYYLPSSASGLPIVDPYVRPRIVTRAIFSDFLRERGVREEAVEEEILRFERAKRNDGILSEMMIPLHFQEYVIGYVVLLNRLQGKPPFDLAVLDTFFLFSKILSYSLVINGYFKSAPKRVQEFSADVLDISAGGILFSNASKELAAALLPGCRIELSIKAGERTVKAPAELRRTYRDSSRVYYGVEFDDIQPEDFRFLFESLYGREFTDADATGIEGLGIKMPIKLD